MALCQHNEHKNEICTNCGLNRRIYRDQGFKNIKSENLRTNEYSIDTDFDTICKQSLAECKIFSNIFYRAINNKSTWFDENVDTNNTNFFLIGPILD